MTTKSTTPPLSRDSYGALNPALILLPEHQLQLSELLALAIKAGSLPQPFITGNNREMECLNLDIYDVRVFRNRVKWLIVQVRTFWKHKRKGYTRCQKSYFLVTKSGRKVEVLELENSTCAKRAKNTRVLGELVGHYSGNNQVACKAPVINIDSAYKVLAKGEDGRLVSAYDGSEYKVGIWRSEAAKPGHGGGFYFYRDDALAIEATERGDTFANSVAAGKQLVLCRVEVAGRMLEYGDGKWAASRMRVLSIERPVEFDVNE